MKKNIFLCIAFHFIISSFLFGQQSITLENIWQDYTFSTRSVPGFNFLKDGKHYTRKSGNKIQQFDLTTGEVVKDIFDAETFKELNGFNGRIDDYTLSDDENKILIKTQTESIYRYSTKGFFFVFDRNTQQLSPLSPVGKQGYATFSPDASMVAFVRENNLFVVNLETNTETQITFDGAQNEIINGASDWVYEEEFSLVRAFEWSADNQKIAFLRFDESAVQEFTMTLHHDEAYPEYRKFKYPKVGEKNATVTTHIYHINDNRTIDVSISADPETYFPRIKWTRDANQLCLFQMNRHQNKLDLLLVNANNGQSTTLLTETSPYYVDITDDLTFLKDGTHFIWSSEKSGTNQLYLYSMDGQEKIMLTSGREEVTEFYGVDEENKRIYFQKTSDNGLRRDLFEANLKGKITRQLNKNKGWNTAQFSSTFDYYVLNYSTANTPPVFTVCKRNDKPIRILEDNARTDTLQADFGWQPVNFTNIPTTNNLSLNAWMIKPPSFSEDKRYPVFMYVYGGPGSQTVSDKWGGFNFWWFQMLAQKGYIVVSVDNRGTGGRGTEFKKMTYLQLGNYETTDQIESATYLGSLPYVDAGRIGIFGWSYGGYMSSLCILKGSEVFKSAIAVAPVTNWKWYDSIYTERYMRTTAENPDGYKNNSPVYFADQLKGNYLLVHGMADDNVHFQHTAEMVNALVMANKQFDTYFYPNKNHSIYGGPARLHLYTKMTNFLLEKL